jgi:hypothetical protein
MKKWLVLACIAAIANLALLVGPVRADCPAVGAIRWDAWFGEKGTPGKAVEKSLGPSRWHERLPECAKVVAPDQVRIACDSPEQMQREMRDAAESGIDFWAFVTYSPEDPMNNGLAAYLASKDQTGPRFALITEFDRWAGASLYKTVTDRYIRLMTDPRYQRTPDGRPLFFLGFVSEAAITKRFGSTQGFADAVTSFRTRAQAAGLPNPYIVLLDGNVDRGLAWINAFGLDGISAYFITDGRVRHGTFAQLSALSQRYWAQAADKGLAVVPPVMTGWDRRPRVQNPVPWEKGSYSEEQMERYFAAPTPDELRAQLRAAIDFASKPTTDKPGANAVLIYAWNEFDEGGWLAPTGAGDRSRLQAVKRAIPTSCAATNPAR